MPTSATRWRNTFGYYGLFVCLGLGMAIMGPTLKLLACQTGSAVEAMGWLFFCGSVGYTLGTLLGGRLFDRVVHGNALLGGAELAAACCLALLPLVGRLWLFLAIVFVRGMLEGIVNTGGNTLLLWTHREKASPFLNGLHFCFGVGAFVAPLVVAWFVGTGPGADAALCTASPGVGYRGAYWAVAGFAALASLWVLTMSGSPDPREHLAHAKRARTGRAGIHYAPVVIAAVYLFAYVGGEISFGSWIATYASELRIADTRGAALLTSAFWFSFTAGRLLSVPVAVRFTPRQVIPAALIPSLVIAGLLMLLPASTALLWIAAIALGFCMAPLWPSGFTLAGQVVPLTGSVSSLVLLGDSFGGMILPSLTGKIMEAAKGGGMRWLSASLPLLVFGSMLVCLITYLALAAHHRPPARAAEPAGMAGGD